MFGEQECPKVSRRAREITPFIAMDVMETAQAMERNGESIIHLEVGEPDFDTPECIKEAAAKALRDGKTHYTDSRGLIELREAVAQHYGRQYGVTASPEQVLITSGTSPAMFMLFSALLEPRQEIIISDPHYACYPNFIQFVQGKPVRVQVYEEDGFQYRPEEIGKKIGAETKGIFINSPSNPTGTLLSAERMQALARFDPYIISDEIYHGLVYGEQEHSILEFTDRAFVLNGFSKLYAMTGWRLGYLIAPREFIRPLQKIHQNFFISANSISQWAGIAALNQAQADVARMRDLYNQRRILMIDRLKKMGFGLAVEPTGAFYVLANAKAFHQDSYRLAFDILKKAKIGVTPGIDFGSGAEGYLRFTYANSIERIEEGMERLKNYLEQERFKNIL
ncbi:MAG TPA: pyridoxal phosphate-dependent aminotransferase [Thermodesulfobacteriota bacterium]|nr:pyridoxal phosphate-dependent aminotransferase [Thermodesulfobacteriota bacterium]